MKTIDRVGSAFLRAILLRMKELVVNQTELARRMKVSRPYITKVLSQDVNFSFRTAAKLAEALKMDFMPLLIPSSEEEGVVEMEVSKTLST
jgi:predicted transcriptional regulator